MRVINRTAISVVGGQPYVDWTRHHAGDGSSEAVTVARAKPFGAAVLLPEFEFEEDVQEWVEDNWSWLFELQLDAWTSDQSSWPAERDLRMFREWFRVDIHNIVVDAAEGDIEGEEL